MVAFPVYRSYLPEGSTYWATPSVQPSERSPTCRAGRWTEQVRADPHGELATRIQQTSGMVMAKGVEDTAFYRCTRFVALNEVGGAPDRFGVPVDEFHRARPHREAALAGVDDHAVHARHQALRGRAGPAGRAVRAAGRVRRPLRGVGQRHGSPSRR